MKDRYKKYYQKNKEIISEKRKQRRREDPDLKLYEDRYRANKPKGVSPGLPPSSFIKHDGKKHRVYAISEVCKKVGLQRHVIKGWTKSGHLPPPIEKRGKHYYTDAHIRWYTEAAQTALIRKDRRNFMDRGMMEIIKSNLWEFDPWD